ncbi:DciA family protein [Streptomyces sp. WAC05858]|uniref:DciA family protein n=1 Tax=Streptomyces TaxID=1883 RepID=UPI00163BBD99|nr:DciA family protein [Streptomyces sp. WAC05858]
MNNHEAPSGLAHPEWLGDVASWWGRAFPAPSTAACFRPLGVDGQGRLHVRCRNHAYAVLLRQLQASVISRINSTVPQANLAGLLPEQRPMVRVLVVADQSFTHRQRLDDVLLEMWHDITQVVGTEHEIHLQLTGQTVFDRQVCEWATAQAATSPDINEPFSTGVCLDDDASAWDQRLLDASLALCVAFCPSEATLPPPARLALAAGIPVWRAE